MCRTRAPTFGGTKHEVRVEPVTLRRRRALVLYGALCAVLPPALGAQELSGWRTFYKDAFFDYLLLESHTVPVDSSAAGPVQVIVSRMLIREPGEGRSRRSTERIQAGRDTVGYAGYASTTVVLDLDCRSGEIRVLSAKDFRRDGTVLSADTPAGPWLRGAAGARLRAWACAGTGEGDGVRSRKGDGLGA
ncbi:MAG: hypothetical protein D6701_09200, partial [Gemmatimonadetes bacterium]